MSEQNGKRIQKKEAKEKRPSRLSRGQKWLLVLAAVLAAALAVTVTLKTLFVKPELPNKGEDTQGGDTQGEDVIDYGDGVQPRVSGERKSQDYYTVLILGRDTGGGGNTDTMLLASYDVTNQKATVMSIPRDTMVNVSWDVKKINSVYNMNGGGEKGIKALYKEISQLVGFEPDYQVIIEWEAVGKLVAGKTVLVIAHRLSTITGADQIVVVNGGRIQDAGTHEELLKNCPLYQEMWRAHMGAKEGEQA